MLTRMSLAAVSVLGIAALSACQSTSTEEEAMDDEMMVESMAMITVANQPAAESVTVGSVTIPVDGFVVIHASNEDGSPSVPGSIGHIAVTAGTHENVVVPLTEPVAAGDQVYAMLHVDSGEIGVYEFNVGSTDVDLPVIENEAPVVIPLMLE